jgi:Holliday junction resolvase RusA-like endonuclease
MNKAITYCLLITPQTHVRSTKDERWLFAEGVTDEYLVEFGTRKHNERIAAGKNSNRSPNDYLNRKYVIKRYFDYKVALRKEAERVRLTFPEFGAWVKFYLPMPKSWSSKKREKMRYELHHSKPDADNMFKGFADSLFKEDKRISDYRVSKFWHDQGFIEVEMGSLQPAIGYRKFQIIEKIK